MVDYETLVLTGIIGFLTTLSGVVIAFALTLGYDRKKKQEEERETRSRVAKAIQLELEGNLEIINENRQKFEKEQQQGFLILFPSGAYQSAIGSGFFHYLIRSCNTIWHRPTRGSSGSNPCHHECYP